MGKGCRDLFPSPAADLCSTLQLPLVVRQPRLVKGRLHSRYIMLAGERQPPGFFHGLEPGVCVVERHVRIAKRQRHGRPGRVILVQQIERSLGQGELCVGIGGGIRGQGCQGGARCSSLAEKQASGLPVCQ